MGTEQPLRHEVGVQVTVGPLYWRACALEDLQNKEYTEYAATVLVGLCARKGESLIVRSLGRCTVPLRFATEV
jgi:hypothetical protein